jgi:hypothetical protein
LSSPLPTGALPDNSRSAGETIFVYATGLGLFMKLTEQTGILCRLEASGEPFEDPPEK